MTRVGANEWSSKRLLIGALLALGLAPVHPAAADLATGIVAYREGDFLKAAIEFRIAAEKNDPLAQLNLGLLFDRGEGVEQDYAQAAGWYRKAAEAGNARAQTNLGSMYFSGLGVEQDYESAARWYRRAAIGGNVTAQYNLAVLHELGLGVVQDLVQAKAWMEIAAATEGQVPPEELEGLSKKLSVDEQVQAQALVDRYFKNRNQPLGDFE